VRAFSCPVCRRLVTFGSHRCLHSDTPLAFDWTVREIVELESPADRCANHELAGCNWLAPGGGLCFGCRLTRTRPGDDDGAGLGGFLRAEEAKRRLLFELGELGLPVEGFAEREGGLAFDLLSSASTAVTTGHADGVITLDLAEADPAHRERMRMAMDEPYRTVLGTLRHEIGHYYQPILIVEDSATQEECRALFGDERADYAEAIDRHYAEGPPDDWPAGFVSAYATMHPWEDWAETFAHYLHIVATLQTASAHGVRVDGPAVPTADVAPLESDPRETSGELRSLLDAWLPLTYALNALNRSMGAADLYPFVLGPRVIEKLAFIDRLVRVPTRAA
jgi:hypothetical protein